jgi:hypothetical protein
MYDDDLTKFAPFSIPNSFESRSKRFRGTISADSTVPTLPSPFTFGMSKLLKVVVVLNKLKVFIFKKYSSGSFVCPE